MYHESWIVVVAMLEFRSGLVLADGSVFGLSGSVFLVARLPFGSFTSTKSPS